MLSIKLNVKVSQVSVLHNARMQVQGCNKIFGCEVVTDEKYRVLEKVIFLYWVGIPVLPHQLHTKCAIQCSLAGTLSSNDQPHCFHRGA
jgi:hypothetical protein